LARWPFESKAGDVGIWGPCWSWSQRSLLSRQQSRFAGPPCRSLLYAKPGEKHSCFLVKSEEVY